MGREAPITRRTSRKYTNRMNRREFTKSFAWALPGLAAPAILSLPAQTISRPTRQKPHEFYVSSSAGNDRNDGRSPQTAWQSLTRVNTADFQPGDKVLFRRNDLWRGSLRPKSGAEGWPITYGAYGDGAKPILQGSVAKDMPASWMSAGRNLWTTSPAPAPNPVLRMSPRSSSEEIGSEGTLDVDVGNIVFDHGCECGTKKWQREDLHQNGDFWYDPNSHQVWLYSDAPPHTKHRSIELALRRHIIDETGCQFVNYEDLHLRYGAAHGIGGGDTGHITVRQCDVCFIGGGQQFTDRQVRFGNGIEFWNTGKDNRVEQCRLWEIYDAALTNQGLGPISEQVNIVYRNNVIWNAEYSFEYWNRPETARTQDIVFENNTCVDSGLGWGHRQRPDPNGHHLMFWQNSAATTGVVVRNNIFFNATESCLRMDNDWRRGLALDRNLWFQNHQIPVFIFMGQQFRADQLDAYRTISGFDSHSVVADPCFRDSDLHDYRLRPDSPALHWSAGGESCGASIR